jgi:aminopeptidase N
VLSRASAGASVAMLTLIGVGLGVGPDASAQRFREADQRPQFQPARTFDAHHLKLDIRLDVHSRSVAGTSTLDLTLLRRSPVLWLHAADMEIESVLVDGAACPFQLVGERLRVELPDTAPLGKRIAVAVTYAARPQRGLYFVLPDSAYPHRPTQAWTQGESHDHRFWYPGFDDLGDRLSTEVRVTCRKPLVAISNGALLSTQDAEPGWHTFHFKQARGHVNYLVSLVVGDFERVELRPYQDRVPLSVYLHRRLLPYWERSFQETGEMMAFLEDLTGEPYAFEKYAQVLVTDFRWAGMENTGATTLTSRTITDDRAALDWSSRALVMHELAHQWFGNLITCRSWAHLWLNEGLATYLESLWFEKKVGADRAVADRLSNLDWYLGETTRRGVAEDRYEHPDDLFDGHTYAKGSWVIHMLRRRLGDEHFKRGLQLYVKRHRDGLVETNDLRRAFEDVSGDSLGRFFDQWVHRPGHPVVVSRWSYSADDNRLQLTLTQTQDGAPFSFTLPIRIHGQTTVRNRQVAVSARSETVSFRLSGRPSFVEIDPGRDVLMDLAEDQAQPAWLAQLADGTTAASRSTAADGLAGAEKKGPQRTALKALAAAVSRTDQRYGVRVAAISSIGILGGTKAKSLLLRYLADSDSRVRRAAASQLGSFKGAPVEKALMAAYESDRSYRVAASALVSYQETGAKDALAVAMKALRRDSHRNVIREAAVGVLRAIDTEESFAALLAHTRYGAGPTSSRQDATATLGSMGQPAARKTRAKLRLVALLKDPRYLVQRAAVGSLGKLGDKSVVEALRTARKRAISREMELKIDDSIMLLTRTDDKDKAAALRKKLDLLKVQVRDLETGLKHLENR